MDKKDNLIYLKHILDVIYRIKKYTKMKIISQKDFCLAADIY